MDTIEWLKGRVASHFELGEYEGSLPYLEQLLRLAGKNVDDLYFAHMGFGTAYLNIKKYNSAVKHLTKAIEVSGEDVDTLFLLAKSYEGLNQIEKALECLLRAEKLAPDNELILISISILRFLLGKEKEAEDGFRKVLEKDPTLVEAYVGLAQCKIAQDNFEEAKAILMKAKEVNPNALIVYQSLKEMEKLKNLKDVLYSLDDLVGMEEWLTPNEEVEEEIRTLMVENHFPPEAIESAERMWDDYAERADIKVRTGVEAWAGAVVFAMAQLMGRKDVKQKELAKILSINVSSISKNYRAIVNMLALDKDGRKKYLPLPKNRE